MKFVELKRKFGNLPENLKIYVGGISICLACLVVRQVFVVAIPVLIGIVIMKVIAFKKK